VDNAGQRIDRVRLGAVGGLDTGTSGTLHFDAFESRRQRYIGPVGGPVGQPPPGSGRAGGDSGSVTVDVAPPSSEVVLAAGVTTTASVTAGGATAWVMIGPDGQTEASSVRLSYAPDYFLPGRMLLAAGPFEVELLPGGVVAAAAAAPSVDVALELPPHPTNAPLLLLLFDPAAPQWAQAASVTGGATVLRASPNRPVLFAAAVDAAALPIQLHLPMLRTR
jgi:hypothetical protein